jgi:hypothetical protein
MSMKFSKPYCPECGELADGTLEAITGNALLNFDSKTMLAEYGGETKMFWDEQRTIRNGRGQAKLLCHNSHDWWSGMKEIKDK